MEGVESKSQLLGEDNQISPEISIRLAEHVKGFQECVKEITDLMKQDSNFSQMSAESYVEKNLKLSAHVDELSCIHGMLVDLYADLIEEFNKTCPSKIKKHHLESSGSRSPKVSEVSHKLGKDLQGLTEENTKLKGKIQVIESDIQSQLESEHEDIIVLKSYFDDEKSKVVNLQKQVTNFLIVVSDFNSKIITIGEELKASSRKLLFAKYLLSDQLKQQSSKQKAEENHQALALLHKQIDSHSKTVTELQENVAAEISVRDDQIKELETKINQYATEISDLKSTHEARKNKWNADIGKMEIELKEKLQSLDELNKKLKALMLQKDGVDAQLDTLRAEKCSRDNLVQEMEANLKSLQDERARVLVSFKQVQKLKAEIKLKLVELEQEMHKKEVKADTA